MPDESGGGRLEKRCDLHPDPSSLEAEPGAGGSQEAGGLVVLPPAADR